MSNSFPPHTRSQQPHDPGDRSTVLVTGGSGGIGRAICLEFGHAGWRVGVHYHTRQQEAERTAATIKTLGSESVVLQADLRNSQQVEAMIGVCVARWSRLDVMICNAGQTRSGLLLRLRPEDWASIIETNLTGTFHCLTPQGRLAPIPSVSSAREHGSSDTGAVHSNMERAITEGYPTTPACRRDAYHAGHGLAPIGRG